VTSADSPAYAPSSLLEVLPVPGRDQVLQMSRRRGYTRGELIVRQGDDASTFFLLESGSIAVRFTTPAGDGVILSVMGAGDVFGETGVLSPRHERTATAQALSNVSVRVLRYEDFDRVRHQHAEVNEFLLQVLARRADRLSRLVAEAHYVSADRRVARRLFEVGRHFAGTERPVVIPLTQEDIAQLAGTTRPTANQVLQKLAADSLISLARGRIELHDPAGLRARCR
jgi:CRP/FNR family transcriptional regulator, cyclic AMP receptor protein